jgi:hypothetical protein
MHRDAGCATASTVLVAFLRFPQIKREQCPIIEGSQHDKDDNDAKRTRKESVALIRIVYPVALLLLCIGVAPANAGNMPPRLGPS